MCKKALKKFLNTNNYASDKGKNLLYQVLKNDRQKNINIR